MDQNDLNRLKQLSARAIEPHDDWRHASSAERFAAMAAREEFSRTITPRLLLSILEELEAAQGGLQAFETEAGHRTEAGAEAAPPPPRKRLADALEVIRKIAAVEPYPANIRVVSGLARAFAHQTEASESADR